MSNLGTNGLLLCDIRRASSRLAGQVVIQVGETVKQIALVLAYSIIGSLPSFGQALRKLAGKGAKSTVSFVLCTYNTTWVFGAR